MAGVGASPQYLSQVPIIINGTALEEITNFNVEVDGGKVPIETLAKGYTGVSKGISKVNLSFDCMIPAGGPEMDWLNLAGEITPVTVQIGIGTKDFVSSGHIMTASLAQGNGEPPKMSVTGMFPYSKIE